MILGFASSLSRDFDTTNFDFYGKVLSGAKKQRDRWKRAVSLVNGICGEDVAANTCACTSPKARSAAWKSWSPI